MMEIKLMVMAVRVSEALNMATSVSTKTKVLAQFRALQCVKHALLRIEPNELMETYKHERPDRMDTSLKRENVKEIHH